MRVGFELLKALNLRHRGVNIISCPSCARQQYDVIRTVEALEKRVAHITTPMTVSVIGCVVNGPGEARETDIGFTGGGNGTHQVYIAGVPHHRLKDAEHRRPSRRADREEGGGDRGREGGGSRPSDTGRRGVAVRPLLFVDPFKAIPVSKMQPVRGTHDLLPDEYRRFAHVDRRRARRGAPLRLSRDGDADLRVHRAVRPRHRRDDRRGLQGDVHVPGSRRRIAHPAAGIHRRHLPRLRVQRRARAAAAAEDLRRRSDVPLRAAAEGPPAPVPPDRPRSAGRARARAPTSR